MCEFNPVYTWIRADKQHLAVVCEIRNIKNQNNMSEKKQKNKEINF